MTARAAAGALREAAARGFQAWQEVEYQQLSAPSLHRTMARHRTVQAVNAALPALTLRLAGLGWHLAPLPDQVAGGPTAPPGPTLHPGPPRPPPPRGPPGATSAVGWMALTAAVRPPDRSPWWRPRW